MPLFEKILQEDDIKKEIKLDVISLVGKIFYTIKKHFLVYYDFNINMLLSACELSLSVSEDDNDFEDYLQNLRFTLVSSFTLFFYGLEDCGQTSKIEPYIEKIFLFYSALITNDVYDIRADTLKGILGFVMDMISTIGRNIKHVINPAVLEKLLMRIKESKVQKLIEYAIECEGVSLINKVKFINRI